MSKFRIGDYVEAINLCTGDKTNNVRVGERGYIVFIKDNIYRVNFKDSNTDRKFCMQNKKISDKYYYCMYAHQLKLVEDVEYVEEKPMNKVEKHMGICKKLNALYEAKNHDYGDSFGKSYKEYGLNMACIRLEDKLNRLKSINFNKTTKVADESLIDTLMDLANYSIMTVLELELEKEGEE